jgi:hypothetical protein
VILGVVGYWVLWDIGCYGILGVMGCWVLWDIGVVGYWVLWKPHARLTSLKKLQVPSRKVKIGSKVFKINFA